MTHSLDRWLLKQIFSLASLCRGGVLKDQDAASVATNSEPCDLPIVDVTSLTADQFGRRFRKPSRPVLLSNIGTSWAARKRWTQTEMLKHYGDDRVLSQHVRVLSEVWQGNESVKSILVEGMGNLSILLRQGHKMVNEMQGDWNVPPALAHLQKEGPIMSIGNKHSRVVFHGHVESWLAQVQGRKLWILAPPGTDLSGWGSACKVPSKEFAAPVSKRNVVWCVALPGHAIYVPDGWLHGTCNLDEHSIGAGFFGGWWNTIALAAAHGDKSIVKRTLKQEGAGAALQRDGPFTPFVAAAMRGHTSMVKELATAARGQPEMRPALSQALIGACFSNSAPTAALLIRLRADPNVNDGSSTPLSECVRNGAVDMIATLIQLRADVNSAAVRDSFPLEGAPLAAKAGNHGHREIVELLIAQRVSMNMRDKEGRTVLQHSIPYPYVVEYLLQMRADPHLQDNKRRSIVHDTVDRNLCSKSTLERVLSVWPKTINYAMDQQGRRPLQIAAERGHAVCVELLLSHGAPTVKRGPGSPTHLAEHAGHWAVLQALVALGGVLPWPRGGAMSKAAWRLAASEGIKAEDWLRRFESETRGGEACDILHGTCSQ